ncbi:MAG TPA: restriction endonuclease, partial [Streptosporangiaceae bacterium]|nr:restriction endonuclease [Streptosporangiaceae bacterium]
MPEYDFRTLSPTDFEYLVGDVLNADLGLRLHSYPEGRDQGIDLRQVAAGGHTTIVQCKHYLKSSPSTFLTAVRKEAGKPALRVADRYLFVTSHDLSAAREDEVARILGIPPGDVWGPRAINDALGRHPDVERRHFKLWLSSTTALDAILHAGRWRRGDALLEEAADRAKYWVETPAYEAVRDIIEASGSCLVTGPPGVGKTFLAEMIVLAAARDGWQIVDLSAGIEDAWAAAHPSTRQLFYYDDFLGQAALEHTAAAATGLVRFISYVRRNARHKRLIMTSREQVLGQASAAISDRLRQLAGDPARYTIALDSYDPAVRAEILL